MYGKLSRSYPSSDSFTLSVFEDDYQLTTQILSTGARHKTYLGRCLETKEPVAVKIILKHFLKASSLKRIVNEAKVLKYLKHPNIVTVHDIYDREDAIYVVSEYIQGPSLEDKVLDESFDFSEAECKVVLKTVVSALRYCHNQGVVHRNLIPENIIFSNTGGNNVIKIVDFQWSKTLDREEMDFSLLETMCGKPTFVAPEILSSRCYNYKCDVWSLGVVLFVLLSGGYLPFSSKNRESVSQLLSQVKRGSWSFQPANAWTDISPEAKDLVSNMLQVKPGARYTYEQILAHEFCNNLALRRTTTSVSSYTAVSSML